MIRFYFRHGIAAAMLLLICASCDILRDRPFEVSNWSPGGGYHENPQAIEIFVSFSHEPDRSSVEKYFSVTADAETVRGNFLWKGRTLYFLPLVPFEADKDYFVKISAAASNTKGLSMDREFTAGFSTRANNARPRIISFYPETEGIMDRNYGVFQIIFSCPVSVNSLRGNASFSPSISGAWHLEENGLTAVFTPSELWPQGRRFELRLSDFLSGNNGINMGKDFISIFTVGAEREPPYLNSAWKVSDNGDQKEIDNVLLGEFTENSGWEKNDKLKLIFSTEVDLLSVSSAITAENTSTLILEIPSVETVFSQEAVFRFEKAPAFESRFLFRLKGGVRDIYGNESKEEYAFRIYADGENSKPPSLAGIRIPMSPNGDLDDDDPRLMAYGPAQLFADLPIEDEYYPYYTETAAWIECYFDCAPGVGIDLFSLMEKFRVETSNNALTFTPMIVKNSNFTISDPHPAWGHFQRVEIAGMLTNNVSAGVVHFVVNQGLSDSKGNLSEKQFRISLLK